MLGLASSGVCELDNPPATTAHPQTPLYPVISLLCSMILAGAFQLRRLICVICPVSFVSSAPSQPLVHKPPNCGEERETKVALMLCKHCSATAKTLLCGMSIVLVTDLKHTTIPAATKKINSLPSRPEQIFTA